MVDFEKRSEGSEPKDFGPSFDYDATAEASLSEQPATTEAGPSHGPTSTTGPGWDTYSGVGNGPGWGESPSYPAPSSPAENHPVENYPVHDAPPPSPTENYPTQGYPTQGYAGQNYPQNSGQYPVVPQGQFPPPQPGYPYSAQPGYGYPTQPGPGYQAQPGYGSPQPSGYGYPPQPMYGAAPYGVGAGSDAPFGRDPITGDALSDKSKVAAGLLQIFLGGFGAGRFYIGSNGVAVAQLLLLIVGWLTSFVGIGLVVLFGLFIWVVVDGIVMLVGNAKDGNGRKLRN
ncbi:TM2 domain-containing protein [Rhodococcoides yunnanense]|uniref:TM2 domain-containing protein n=1 Tax=Rhodococcoides yunnanense TaxID=278209 RepID=UPI0009351F4D|nr:TM2 domain-containing protein [Rhodococcus yunnanensis]